MATHSTIAQDANLSTAPSRRVKPRLLIIGAGSRGHSYARAAVDSGLAIVAAVAEPIEFKRKLFGRQYIWAKDGASQPHEQFAGWRDWIAYEEKRRKDQADGIAVAAGIDAVFVCVRDEHHMEVLTALTPFGLHIMSEKPLATTLGDCLRIRDALKAAPERIFAIGHVLRYSPHNMLLRHLLLERRVIGDILSIEHTEPVGWWHFSHSYVRGNWRKESTTAPSLLTKSCHDIDFLLWILCAASSSAAGSSTSAQPAKRHLPARISSVGSLKQFRRSQKPVAAGAATNCLSCPLVDTCKFSAPRIYNHKHLAKGATAWPVEIVNPTVGTILKTQGTAAAEEALLGTLAEDYQVGTTSVPDIEGRSWYGRCVWESDNDVCDDQYVTIEWDDEEGSSSTSTTCSPGPGGAKTASFHMIAQTLAQCERRGRIYGTDGEISYDSKRITLHDFNTDLTQTFDPEVPKKSHHGGGDDGLTQQFIKAVAAVLMNEMAVPQAQEHFLGCTMADIILSHAAVFAAEQARRQREVLNWPSWWAENVGD